MNKKMFGKLLMVLMTVCLVCACSGGSGSSGTVGGEQEGVDNKEGGDSTGATATTYTLSGTLSGNGIDAVKMTLSGAASSEATTAADGKYSFTGLAAGDYTVTPSKTNVVFTPTSTNVTVSENEEVNFTTSAYQTLSISKTDSNSGTILRCNDINLTNLSMMRAGKESTDCAEDRLYRFYASYDLSGLGASPTIVSATLSFDQAITGTPYSTGVLTIDHVDYGTFEPTDWSETLEITNASVTTNNTTIAGEINLGTDLMSYVNTELAAGRIQFVFKFPDTVTEGSYIEITDPTLVVTYY